LATKKFWLHVDQSYLRNNLETYQSWVTPLDVNDGDATLVFLKGSHKYHKTIKDQYSISNKDDWYKLSDQQISTYVNDLGCPLQRIKCKAGSIVMWDSRLVHCGCQPLKNRHNPNMRICIYVCMLPKSLATQVDINKKRKAFNEKRLTSHHPIHVKLFPKNPRIYSKDQKTKVVTPLDAQMTELGMKLAGF
jgi:ectoine hydroxylase-related dioxygenase (phytanoyl-CoA dioxygenase family)